MLKTEFVPVAIDQAYQRRQKDSEGEFYRRIAGQGPRSDFENTTQGFYIAAADGDLLLYNNNRDPEKLRRLMQQKLGEFKSKVVASPTVEQASDPTNDPRYNVSPPQGGLVLRVRAKVLDGYKPTDDRWRKIFQSAVSRDNFWVTKQEHRSLVAGDVPESLKKRMAKYHLVDNTRGEPPFWQPRDLKAFRCDIDSGIVRGQVRLANERGDRGYDADLYGVIESEDGAVTKLDFVVRGDFWGEGRYTGGAPEGKFPLAIWFTLADGSDVADRIPPQGSRGWIDGYLQ